LLLAALDLAGRYRTDKYVRPLINKRLQEIENERLGLGLKESDPARYAEGVEESEDQSHT
jgi:hypothetical protein